VAARHPATPLDTVLQLMQDQNEDVRRAAFSNPGIPMDHPSLLAALDDFAYNDHWQLSEETMMKLNKKLKLAGDSYKARRYIKAISRRKLIGLHP